MQRSAVIVQSARPVDGLAAARFHPIGLAAFSVRVVVGAVEHLLDCVLGFKRPGQKTRNMLGRRHCHLGIEETSGSRIGIDSELTKIAGGDPRPALDGKVHRRGDKRDTSLHQLRKWQGARRIARAKDLLAETAMPVIDVGGTVGYDSPSHFASLFRRHVGISPSEYRRLRRL